MRCFSSFRLFLTCVGILSLAACAPLPPKHTSSNPMANVQVEAQKPEISLMEQRLAHQFTQAKRQFIALCIARDTTPYYKNAPCFAQEATPRQLKNKRKPTQKELTAAKNVFNQLRLINLETRLHMLLLDRREKTYQKIENIEDFDIQIAELQQQFLLGKMSWGEFNSKRKEIALEALNLNVQ